MTDDYTKRLEEKERENEFYDNSMEFFGKFILSPEINEYEHLDKNLATTNLRSRFQENERVRSILERLHILNNYRRYKKIKQIAVNKKGEELHKQTMSEDDKGRQVLVNTPIYEEVMMVQYRYPLTVRYNMSLFYSFVTTSAATDGHLMKALTTKRFEREESVEDKTEVKSRWGMWPKKTGGNEGYGR